MNILLNESVGIIGLGNMGLAILNGIRPVFGYDSFIEKKTILENVGGTWLNSEAEVAQKCKYVLLAVKPQSVPEVLEKIAPVLTPDSVIISICAGISAEFIRARTSAEQKVVRVMPNTPMMLGEGASAVSSDVFTSSEELEFACSLIGSSSPVVEIIPAEKMNEIVCVNGSSPAFIYLFAKCFLEFAKGQGIEEESALRLFSQTLIGSGKMLLESRATADELIAQVSSKGGTTVAGLEALQKSGFCEAVEAACKACTERVYELGR